MRSSLSAKVMPATVVRNWKRRSTAIFCEVNVSKVVGKGEVNMDGTHEIWRRGGVKLETGCEVGERCEVGEYGVKSETGREVGER
jgi:hypothetical protein